MEREREREAAVTLWLLLNEGVVCNAMCNLGPVSPDEDTHTHAHTHHLQSCCIKKNKDTPLGF